MIQYHYYILPYTNMKKYTILHFTIITTAFVIGYLSAKLTQFYFIGVLF